MSARFGEMIGTARRSRRITLKEMSQAVGVGSSNISEMEHGHRLPPSDAHVVSRFAKFLGLDQGKLQNAAQIERKARQSFVDNRIFQIDPTLACGLAREVEALDDAELASVLKQAVKLLERNRKKNENLKK